MITNYLVKKINKDEMKYHFYKIYGNKKVWFTIKRVLFRTIYKIIIKINKKSTIN